MKGQITYDTVPLTWRRGFPPNTGMYLVELQDGEHIVRMSVESAATPHTQIPCPAVKPGGQR